MTTPKMTTGLMFQDSSTRPLEVKVREAAKGYLAKHGIMPNTCHVHKSLCAEPCWVDGIRVLPLCKPAGHLKVGRV